MILEKETIYTRNHQIYVERHGNPENPQVIFLHHGLGSVASWQRQITFFVENGFGVWLYDRWGYGLSSDRPALDPPWFQDDVDDLATLLINERKPVFLVGHSDGGNVALSYTLQYPKKVLGVVVVAAHIYFEPKMATGILQLRSAYEQSESFRRGLQRYHGDKPVFERWWRAWTSLEPGWDMRCQFSQINRPCLVMQGEQDEHATVKHAHDLAKAIPHSKLWIVENASHMLPQDHSDVFNPCVLLFLEELNKEAERKNVQ